MPGSGLLSTKSFAHPFQFFFSFKSGFAQCRFVVLFCEPHGLEKSAVYKRIESLACPVLRKPEPSRARYLMRSICAHRFILSNAQKNKLTCAQPTSSYGQAIPTSS